MIARPHVGIMTVCLTFCLASCSVKEDRRECPVLVQLDMSSHYAEGQDVIIRASGEEVSVKQYYYPGLSDTLLQFSMPKGPLTISGYTAMRNCYCEGSVVRCRPGCQYDRLYTYSNSLLAYGEFAPDTVVLHKQFSRMDFNLSHILDAGDSLWTASVVGGYSGLETSTGLPLEGSYDVPCERQDKASFSLRVPRQGDDRLELRLTSGRDRGLTFPIGAMLRQAGFDWSAIDLDDVRLDIKTFEADVSIVIVDWETGFEKYVEI